MFLQHLGPITLLTFEQFFPTVVQVQGFSEDNAEKFVTKILCDKTKVDGVLKLNSESLQQEGSLHSPMILLFTAILVQAGEIDLQRKNVTLGEIYFRLVRCIYRK